MEVILYSKECNWYTRCCPLNGGVHYRECPLRETILYLHVHYAHTVLTSISPVFLVAVLLYSTAYSLGESLTNRI